MSDDLEHRLREAGHRLPWPTDLETHHARTRVLAARRRPRKLVFALAAALALAGAFGVGYALASGSKPKLRLIVKHIPVRLNAGPGFLPAPGWNTEGNDRSASATNPRTYVFAQFTPASLVPGLPQKLLPLQLPAGGRIRHVRAHVGAYAVDVKIGFASPTPSAGDVTAAREELGRLVVPSCPSARSVRPADVAAAIHGVFRWLPANYPGKPANIVGATATGRLGRDMPRYREAAADCGAIVASRSFEVDVRLPPVAKVSASLSELTYFVAKTARGWTVWERVR